MTRVRFIAAFIVVIILYMLLYYVYSLIIPEVWSYRLEMFLTRSGTTIVFGVSITIIILKRLKRLQSPRKLCFLVWPALASAVVFEWFLFFPNDFNRALYTSRAYSFVSMLSYFGAIIFFIYLVWKKESPTGIKKR